MKRIMKAVGWVGCCGVFVGVSVWGGDIIAADEGRVIRGTIRPTDGGVSESGSNEDPLLGFNTDRLTVSPGELTSGGPGKDGIASLTFPESVPVARASFLDADARVIGVTVNGESRAYPVALMNWHEVINDELGYDEQGGLVPIAVIFCPLCDSVSVVDRRAGGAVYEFGVSGLLYNSNVVLYDRVDDALWSQVGMVALSGPNAGWALRHLTGWELTTFDAWKRGHPGSSVVGFNTRHRRNYRENPYEKYLENDKVSFPVKHADRRMANKERVIGVRIGEVTRAYPVRLLAERGGGVFQDLIEGRAVRMRVDRSGAVHVVEAPAEVQVVHTFWFAWAAFYPDTQLWVGDR